MNINQKNYYLIQKPPLRKIDWLLAMALNDKSNLERNYRGIEENALLSKDTNKKNKLAAKNYPDFQSISFFSFDFVAFVEEILRPRAHYSQATFQHQPMTFLKAKLLDVAFRLWIKSYGAHLRIKRNVRDIYDLSLKFLKNIF